MKRFPLLLAALLLSAGAHADPTLKAGKNFQRENLVAWCIVPFDTEKRGPAARAELLVDLGLTRCAYDWRAEHVPTFEDEIQQYAKHNIEFTAFWSTHESAFRLFKQYDIHPAIWKTLPSPKAETQAAKVAAATQSMIPLAKQCKAQRLKLGLYNHGGWGGEPENMAAVCAVLHQAGYPNVGIVYNFHHGHSHMADFPAVMKQLIPYLLCVNLNGMNDGAEPKILPIGQGQHEKAMIQAVIESGYAGPIGILGHMKTEDVRISLEKNLHGLERVLKELSEGK